MYMNINWYAHMQRPLQASSTTITRSSRKHLTVDNAPDLREAAGNATAQLGGSAAVSAAMFKKGCGECRGADKGADSSD